LAASHSSFAHFRKLYIPVSAWHQTGLSTTDKFYHLTYGLSHSYLWTPHLTVWYFSGEI
jgi:hypothetical protein